VFSQKKTRSTRESLLKSPLAGDSGLIHEVGFINFDSNFGEQTSDEKNKTIFSVQVRSIFEWIYVN
jgi:hypothetical protein